MTSIATAKLLPSSSNKLILEKQKVIDQMEMVLQAQEQQCLEMSMLMEKQIIDLTSQIQLEQLEVDRIKKLANKKLSTERERICNLNSSFAAKQEELSEMQSELKALKIVSSVVLGIIFLIFIGGFMFTPT